MERTYSCPIPHGMGGLKYLLPSLIGTPPPSHPTRDGWIEIPQNNCGEKSPLSPIPHGMGGLKFDGVEVDQQNVASHPTRDGWIEI